MGITQYIPAAITVLSGLSAVVCAWQGEWRNALYWTGATVIGVAMTMRQ